MPTVPQVLFYVGYDDDRGGICSFVRALAPAAGSHFEMALGVNEGARIVRSAGVEMGGKTAATLRVVEFPRIDGERISPRTMLRARTVARAVRAWLREDSRRIFHGCSRAGLLVALWLARWGERRAVATVHCYGRQRWFYRYAARQLRRGEEERMFFITPAMARYYGVRHGQTWEECLPPCVRMEAEGVNANVSKTAQPEASPYLVIQAAGAGAIVRWKRWELVIEAMARLPEDVRARWRFTHIGGSDGSADSERYARELAVRTRELGLGEQVRWLGQQPSAEPLLRESDVLIVASDNEPFSVARLEALALGVPSISADSGGATDLIMVEPPTNGWLFQGGDADDLARVMTAISDRERNVIADMRIDWDGLRRFSAEASAEKHARIYEQLLAS